MDSNIGATTGGVIIPFSSGMTPLNLSSLLGGAVGPAVAVGSASNLPVMVNSGIIDLTGSTSNVAFVVPRNGTITSLSGFFANITNLSLIETTLTIKGQLYQSEDPQSSLFVPVPGAMINLNPGLTGIVSVGQTLSGSLSGLAIPVAQGTRLMMVYSISTSGLSLAQNISGTISGGLNIQ